MVDFCYFKDGSVGEEAIEKGETLFCPVWPVEKTLHQLEELAKELGAANIWGGDFVAVCNAVDYLRGNRRDSQGKVVRCE